MKAKELIVEKWINTSKDINFDLNDGTIKIIHAFQMLCPGCVYRGIPQADELFQKFNSDQVKVLGLHSVFENHEAMPPPALEVFVTEWGLRFPVAIDKRLPDQWMPETMKAYQLQGTPSLIVIDHGGNLKVNHFGHVDQSEIEKLITELIANQKEDLLQKSK